MTRPVGLFGKLSPRIHPQLRDLSAYLSTPTALPPVPTSVAYSHLLPEAQLGMDGNGPDPGLPPGRGPVGDCGFAGFDHFRKLAAAIVGKGETFPTTAQIVEAYLAYNKGQDQGVVLGDFLQFLYTTGLWGTKIAGYAPIHPQDIKGLLQGLQLFGGLYVGIQVSSANQQQFANGEPWDFVKRSPIVGGHCVLHADLSALGGKTATWGAWQLFTAEFWSNQGDEAWVLIPQEFKDSDKGPTVDFEMLEADLGAIQQGRGA